MAISLVGTASGGNTDGADVTISLPAGMAQNDIVLVTGGHANTNPSNAAAVSTGGYTQLLEEHHLNACGMVAAYKRMGASPDTSVTCVGGANASSAVAYTVMVFRGVDTSTAIDATTTSANGGSSQPNSPSITTVSDGAAVISAFVQRYDGAITAPTGYGDAVTVARTDTDKCCAGSAWKAVATAGAENPPQWTASSFLFWIAFSIALKPAESGTFGDGSLSSSGTATASFIQAPEGFLITTGNGTVAFVGTSFATSGAFSMTGTGTAAFQPAGDMSYAMTSTATVLWVGARSKFSAVREVIERGTIQVNIS